MITFSPSLSLESSGQHNAVLPFLLLSSSKPNNIDLKREADPRSPDEHHGKGGPELRFLWSYPGPY